MRQVWVFDYACHVRHGDIHERAALLLRVAMHKPEVMLTVA